MTFTEFVRFAYGLIMGTSVQYVKPRNRYLWPTAVREIDENLSLFLGGSSVCGVLHAGEEAVLINTGLGTAAEELKGRLASFGVKRTEAVVVTSLYEEFSGGHRLYPDSRLLAPRTDTDFLFKQWRERPAKLEVIREEQTLQFAGETLRLIPVGRVHSPSDLVVYLESRRILFAGGLFYNKIHPPLHGGGQLDVTVWVRTLAGLLERLQPEMIVPAEGDPGTPGDVRQFIGYLNDLSNPDVEFQECRRRYDWMEIPSYTSLEENFDLVRDRLKTHTTL